MILLPIANCRLPISLIAECQFPTKPEVFQIGNRQLAIGNKKNRQSIHS